MLTNASRRAMAGARTLYDRLVQDLEHSAKVKQEVISGRRIGFYRLKSQLGSGNFAQVKLGLHLLTNGACTRVIVATSVTFLVRFPQRKWL